MAITFDKALGIHDDAMLLRARRAEVLSNNIANADTPNYKARDLDFKAVLEGQMQLEKPLEMSRTDNAHQYGIADPDYAAELMFRIPHQASVDGNTVEVQEEMARYTKNAMDYQASFNFLDRKFKGLSSAIKGE
ncbi:flagellar basal body rod protein FlgB [Marinobacterium arenosum]|uniref:flagellar basal body rod protein FlgB n=1 Tax=Marinobacterium arenosum TaxID=2862496 RepID=UPI001C97EFE0|nr:flagellar basal body rod protein FlgB [Marinobacterium arenosum]MBY4675918.1 flagellar basal body rod protein FlgB [Marinobacterium arenosum]